MSKKSSPRSGSVRKSSTRALSGVRRPRVNVKAPQKKAPIAPTNQRERIRQYLPVVLIPNLVIVLAIIVIAFAGILFSAGSFSTLPALIAESWFAVHLVPITFDGVTLGVLPLLPAIGIVILLSRRVHRAVKDRVSVLDLYTLAGLVLVIPLTLSGIAWFMVWDAAQVFPVEPPSVLLTLVQPAIIHLAGLVLGMGPTLWKLLARRSSVPEGIVTGAHAAWKIITRLTLVSAGVYLVLLAAGYERLSELLAAYPILSSAGAAGLIVACVLYLPNAAIATLSTLLGGDFAIGAGHVSLFSIDLVPLPVFPLFAAIPGTAATWAPALMLIPLAVLIHFVAKRSWDVISAASTAVFSGLWGLLVAYLASGELGGYGFSGPTLWLMALLLLVWVGVIVFVSWGVAAFRQRRTTQLDSDDDPDQNDLDYDDEVLEEYEQQENPEEGEVLEEEEEPEEEEEEVVETLDDDASDSDDLPADDDEQGPEAVELDGLEDSEVAEGSDEVDPEHSQEK
nr:DUF6350 family protein [Corynebacterium lubricantis]